MSTSLTVNAIYVVVYSRAAPPGDPFHWGLFLKTQDVPNGKLYHAAQRPGWVYLPEDKPFETSYTGILATKIGEVPTWTTFTSFDAFLRQVSVGSNHYASSRHWDCKCWVRDAIQLLHDHRIIRCHNVEALLQEISTLALPLKVGVEWGLTRHHVVTTNLSR